MSSTKAPARRRGQQDLRQQTLSQQQAADVPLQCVLAEIEPKIISPQPGRPVLRKLIEKLLITDADLEAFCLDYFPLVHKRFSAGLNRLSKVNLLFEIVDSSEIFRNLQKAHPEILELMNQSSENGILSNNHKNQTSTNQSTDRSNRKYFIVGLLILTIISPALYSAYYYHPRSSLSGLPPTRMVPISGGSFLMGSLSQDRYSKSDELPAHEVQIRSFMIDDSEVTVSAYEECVHANYCSLPDDGSNCNFKKLDRQNHPINCIDVYQATAFCNWASKRLPTEAEWEFAARGGENRQYPWGNEPPDNQLCWNQINGTCPVRQYQSGKTPTGISDMAGNVAEWTTDKYTACYNPKQCASKELYVVRGGSWAYQSPDYVKSAARGWAAPNTRNGGIGFRCAKNIEDHH